MPNPMQGEAVEDVTNALQRAFGKPSDKGWGATVFYFHVLPNLDLWIEGFTYPFPMSPRETRLLIDNCRMYLDEMERQIAE